MFIVFINFIYNYRYYILNQNGEILKYSDFINFDHNLHEEVKNYKLFFGGIVSENKELISKCHDFCHKFFNITIISIIEKKDKSDYFLYQDIIFQELKLKYRRNLTYIDLSNDIAIYKIEDKKFDYQLIAKFDLLARYIQELSHLSFAISLTDYLKIVINGLCHESEGVLILGMNSNDFFDKEIFFDVTMVNFVEKNLLLNSIVKKLKERISL